MVVELYTWVGWAALFLPLLSPSVAGECIRLEQDTTLLNDLKDMKDRHCYRCYEVSGSRQLQAQLHRVRLKGLASIMIYTGGNANHISEDCGDCQEGTACQECMEIVPERMFELYLRQNTILQLEEGQNACEFIASFNITLGVMSDEPEVEDPPDCNKGFLANFPQSGESCIINTTQVGTEAHCLIPTCSEGILATDGLIEKIEHKFKGSFSPETCVWQLSTEQSKHLTLTFTQDVRPYLTVFEGSLMNPRWDMAWCPAYTNNYKLQTEADTVFVVYHNTKALTKKGSVSITLQAAICLIPPSLENGNVEFQRLESGMVALYSCDDGYTLIGPAKLRCRDGAWSDPPVCLHDKDKLMSDAPMDSVESVDSANVTDLAPENDTSLSPDDGTEQQVKLEAAEEEQREEMMEILEEKEKGEEEGVTSEPDTGDDVEIQIFTTSEIEWIEDYPSNDTLDQPQLIVNATEVESSGGIFTALLNLTLEEDMKLYIIIAGAGLIGLIVIIIISVVVYRKKYPMRLGLGRRFDTFQNPIYEKAVVRVPLRIEEPPPEEKKASDGEEISNCTVLEP
ncbi:Complement control protein C3 [Chionoecetes opilio]|uniref:Complement control protein C3 n=1 Tax=Chionoecetes opilio TaxID=41210 RepID=A0A8J4YN76_CHIOP|nr:Complement control protein C3 [Chionoecetes opilio]